MHRILLPLLLLASAAAHAQYNAKGTFHAGIGGAIGAHGIAYDQTFKVSLFGATISQSRSTTDAAATTTLPIELGMGLGRAFSIGLFLEPGAYVDSSGSAATNALLLVGLQPRFYLVNKDRFAWMASLQLGASALRIQREEGAVKEDARYSGAAVGLGTGVGLKFTDAFGLEFHVRYMGTVMDLKAREVNDRSTMDFYEATLRSGGVLAQLGLAFHFGGS